MLLPVAPVHGSTPVVTMILSLPAHLLQRYDVDIADLKFVGKQAVAADEIERLAVPGSESRTSGLPKTDSANWNGSHLKLSALLFHGGCVKPGLCGVPR